VKNTGALQIDNKGGGGKIKQIPRGCDCLLTYLGLAAARLFSHKHGYHRRYSDVTWTPADTRFLDDSRRYQPTFLFELPCICEEKVAKSCAQLLLAFVAMAQSTKQKVVIVGAGPVGSLAALYAAARGDEVEVYELRGGKPTVVDMSPACSCLLHML
jgi:NADPH-dependent 2,4-dienoyl-CoA reductase/sulfur reductase-like enzyme